MVAIPSEGRWTIRTLGDRDAPEVLEFLGRQPLLNVYLISRILEEGLPERYNVGVNLSGRLVGIASLTSNIVMAAAPDLQPHELATVLDVFADRVMIRGMTVRAMICDARLVEGLWQRIRHRVDPPTVLRLTQPVYALEENHLVSDLQRVRYSTVADLDQLVPACAAMHTEEVGINPLTRDAVGYRERVRELIQHRRSFVLTENNAIAFKTELSAETDTAVQLMGVWTAPQFRRQGFARAGLREICGHLGRRGKKVTLFVNDFNSAAIQLYESLGFVRIGTNRALIW